MYDAKPYILEVGHIAVHGDVFLWSWLAPQFLHRWIAFLGLAQNMWNKRENSTYSQRFPSEYVRFFCSMLKISNDFNQALIPQKPVPSSSLSKGSMPKFREIQQSIQHQASVAAADLCLACHFQGTEVSPPIALRAAAKASPTFPWHVRREASRASAVPCKAKCSSDASSASRSAAEAAGPPCWRRPTPRTPRGR